MAKFRKKPVVIEAIQWTGNNLDKIAGFDPSFEHFEGLKDCNVQALTIQTLEGVLTASIGDWIIRGVKGELYPCKPDIFEATYESVQEPINNP